MNPPENAQRIISRTELSDYLLTWLEAFFLDLRASGKANGTVRFYKIKLGNFAKFCETRAIKGVQQITPDDLRAFLIWLQDGHNEGDIHAHYRAIKAFLRWYEREVEPDGWRNPIRKVKAPRNMPELLEPVDYGTVKRLLAACGDDAFGLRDRAIILVLLDTGLRASELLALKLSDCDAVTGRLVIRRGKGGKGRVVYLGKDARRALRKYLARRNGESGDALFLAREGGGLGYDGLRSMIARRARKAGIPAPEIHSFRRAFALEMLRAGCDVYTLQRLMGHSSLQVLQRYLKQSDCDLAEAHARFSPADSLRK